MGNADSKLNFRKAVIQLTTKTQVGKPSGGRLGQRERRRQQQQHRCARRARQGAEDGSGRAPSPVRGGFLVLREECEAAEGPEHQAAAKAGAVGAAL